MISMFFGVPGVGKTTLLAKIAMKSVGKYQNVYSNVHLKIPGVTYIDDDCIGRYELQNCLILIDEASVFADNRDFKNFNKNGTRLQYFLEHRHHHCDIILFTQGYNAVDKKLRTLTVNLFYMQKGLFGKWFTKYFPIAYGIAFPEGERLGEIAEGYRKPSLIARLFTHKTIFRPAYYKYFDSWCIKELPPLPSCYRPYAEAVEVTEDGSKQKSTIKRLQEHFRNKSKRLQVSDMAGQSETSGDYVQDDYEFSGEYDILYSLPSGGTGEPVISDNENSHSRFSLL